MLLKLSWPEVLTWRGVKARIRREQVEMPNGPVTPTDDLARDLTPTNEGGDTLNTETDDDTTNPPASATEIQAEQFAAEFTDNPCCLPAVRAYSGYIGPSGCGDNWWRLYSSLEFNEYIEFEQNAVELATKHVEQSGAAVGSTQWPDITRTIVWLSVGARIRHNRARSYEVESAFLRGAVTHAVDWSDGQFAVLPTGQGAAGAGSEPLDTFSSKGPC